MAVLQIRHALLIHPLLGVVNCGILLEITWTLTYIETPPVVSYIFIALHLTYHLAQPDLACIRTKRKQAAGSMIKVRKPLIGFTMYERVEYEEEFDAIHERAFVRI